MIEQHYTTADVAARLAVNEETVRRWARRGEIRHVRLGSELRYPESAIVEMLDGCTATVVRLPRQRTRRSA